MIQNEQCQMQCNAIDKICWKSRSGRILLYKFYIDVNLYRQEKKNKKIKKKRERIITEQ